MALTRELSHMHMNKIVITLAVIGGAVTASQAAFLQPYKAPVGSFVSVVKSCAQPKPAPLAAADDFRFLDNFTVNHFRWWGTVSSSQQLFRIYYIAIYKDAGCKPGQRVYQACLMPVQVTFQAKDCQGRNVYNFLGATGAPLPIPPGHYWFRVAESDDVSVRPGKVDFQWSGTRPVRGCTAGQHNLTTWLSPLLDPCDHQQDDLAFCVLG